MFYSGYCQVTITCQKEVILIKNTQVKMIQDFLSKLKMYSLLVVNFAKTTFESTYNPPIKITHFQDYLYSLSVK